VAVAKTYLEIAYLCDLQLASKCITLTFLGTMLLHLVSHAYNMVRGFKVVKVPLYKFDVGANPFKEVL
jgi:hypothetical protein